MMLSALQTVASSSVHFTHLIDLPEAVHAVRRNVFSPIRPVVPYFIQAKGGERYSGDRWGIFRTDCCPKALRDGFCRQIITNNVHLFPPTESTGMPKYLGIDFTRGADEMFGLLQCYAA